MSKVDAMIQSIHEFFFEKGEELGMTPEKINCLMGNMNFMEIYQGVCTKSRPVYAFAIDTIIPGEMEYRSKRLFPGDACLLYDVEDWGCSAESVFAVHHAIELWLRDDMSLVAVSNCLVECDEGDYLANYREVKCEGWPIGEAPIDLEVLATRLHRLGNLRKNTEGFAWHES